VHEKMHALMHADQAVRAISLCETFISACYQKAEEIDDSDGVFGDFVGTISRSTWFGRTRKPMPSCAQE
jgi:hypothetical protein